jgi:signal transduction histidine kinase
VRTAPADVPARVSAPAIADAALAAAPSAPAAARPAAAPPATSDYVLPPALAPGLFGMASPPFVDGDFVAALRVVPGRWITVQPAPEPFPNSWQRRVLLSFAVSFALVAPLGYLFARRLAAPLAAFAAAAERLGRDPSGPVLALAGPAEIGRAASAFTLMQQRLKRYIDDRTAMVGAISHDLRTPLARMRFRLERAPAALKAGMLGDVAQMEEMITSVLVFIRDASEPAVRERVDLRSIVECVVDDAALVGGDAVLDPGAPASVEVDSLGVQRVVTNLVENALKYGRSAHVRLFTDGDEAVTEIIDTGPGLPESELERVFLPFYRAQPARTLNQGGIGLGLAVSRSIARAHGGDVKLYNLGEGLVAQLRLPLAQAG